MYAQWHMGVKVIIFCVGDCVHLRLPVSTLRCRALGSREQRKQSLVCGLLLQNKAGHLVLGPGG